MNRYDDDKIILIRKRRREGIISYEELSEIYGIPSSTIRRWCSDIDIPRENILIIKNRNTRANIMKSQLHTVIKKESLTPEISFFIASILYGCEGAKYPSSNRVEFANSNPNLVAAFLYLLRQSVKLDSLKFRVHLQIHADQSFDSLKDFWSKLLEIPGSQFIAPTIREKRGKKHRREYKGTCTLRYSDYNLQLKLIGVYDEFTKQLAVTV